MSRKARLYIRSTLIFTLVFALIATIVLGTVWVRRILYGDLSDLTDQTMQKSYVNALLCGVDKDGYRTDVLILAQFNLIDNTLNMLQIPRDTYVSTSRFDKKINSAYGHGKEEELFRDVEKLLPGITVDKYMLVDIQGFRDIIDSIGGVEFDVPVDMKYDDPYQDLHIDLQEGFQTLDGKRAEQLVRFRKDNDGRDIQMLLGRSRESVQSDFIYTAAKQIMSLKNAFKIPEFISIATDNVKTNFSYDDFMKYVPMVLDMNSDAMNVMTLPGEDIYQHGGWYFIHEPSKTADVINEFFTPERDEISTQELAIRNQLIGDSSNQEIAVPLATELKKSLLNGLLTVDVIDGSNGNADIDKVVADIKAYGFTVKDINKATTVHFEKTMVIAKKDNADGAKIAKALGIDTFSINTEKRNSTAVTVIVGSDMK